MSEKEAQAHEIVKRKVYWSAGAGFIPLPLVDIAAIMLVQVKMLSDLANLYGLPFSKDRGKALISALIGSVAPTAIADPVASIIKAVPLVGMTVSVVAMPALAGASTYAVGQVFIQHFEAGGTFLDFKPEEVKEYFAEQLEKGKQTLKKEPEPKKA